MWNPENVRNLVQSLLPHFLLSVTLLLPIFLLTRTILYDAVRNLRGPVWEVAFNRKFFINTLGLLFGLPWLWWGHSLWDTYFQNWIFEKDVFKIISGIAQLLSWFRTGAGLFLTSAVSFFVLFVAFSIVYLMVRKVFRENFKGIWGGVLFGLCFLVSLVWGFLVGNHLWSSYVHWYTTPLGPTFNQSGMGIF